MTGREFVTRLLHVSKYRNVFDTNGYFRTEIKKIEAKSEVHTVDLVECMVTLSAELIQKDIDMIDNIDHERLWEDII